MRAFNKNTSEQRKPTRAHVRVLIITPTDLPRHGDPVERAQAREPKKPGFARTEKLPRESRRRTAVR